MAAETGDGAHRGSPDAARQALLKKRLQGHTGTTEQQLSIQALMPGAATRASFAQSRLWFLDCLYDGSSAYHMYRAMRLGGHLDEAALRTALDELLRRHEVLRTAFVVRDGELYQEVADACAMPVRTVSLDTHDAAESALPARLREEVGKLFDLGRPPLMRATLFKLGDNDHVLLLTTHHIASDEWSDDLIANELATLYAGLVSGDRTQLPALPVSYADFAEWQRQRLDVIQADQLEYWRSRLSGELPTLDLPFDHSRPPRPSLRGGLLRRSLSSRLSRAVDQLARTAGVTPFILLLTVFKVLLHRYTGQEDIVVGAPAANRAAPEAEKLVGLFLNSIVLRSYPAATRTFIEFLGEVKEVALGAYEHQELPLELLVANLQPDRDLSRNPLFQVMFVDSSESGGRPNFTGLDVNDVHFDPGVAKFDLTLFTEWRGETLELLAEYSSDVFDETTIDSMLAVFEVLLEGIVENPKAPLGELPLIADTDRDEILATLTGAEPRAVHHPTWLHSFYEIVADRSDAIALESASENLSYGQLDRRARAIAHALRGAGVSRGDFVAVYMDRCFDQVASILGVLQAGAAYVPLDPAYPAGRIEAILGALEQSGERAAAIRVLVCRDAVGELPKNAVPIIVEDVADDEDTGSLSPPAPQDPAYAIFTSGSTGSPKGVVVTHGNLRHSNAARVEYYEQPAERFLLLSSFAFDSSVAGIFWTLGNGGTLILGPPGFERDPRQIGRLIQQHAVTHTLMLPALYELLLQVSSAEQLRSLQTIIVAGEVCPVQVVREHCRQLGHAALYNEYGPTETTVWATVYKVVGDERDDIPIGLPIAGTRVHLLDSRLHAVPRGAVGELCIEGAGVTTGYWGQEQLTQTFFVANPEAPESIIYRTGDRARLSGGQLRYLGRLDEQLKLRGHRIEPAEIVTALQQRANLVEAAVAVVGENVADKRLVAYLVPREQESIDSRSLRRALQDTLPEYMIPARFVELAELPRIPNGKLDMERLAVLSTDAADARIAPKISREADDTLRGVLEIWSRVLGTTVGPDDNFFESGGHSLLGVSLIMSIERELGVELPLSTLFDAPTPASLAERIRDTQEETRFCYVVPFNVQGRKPPIFCIHGGAKLLADHLDEDQPVYLLFRDIGDEAPLNETVEEVAAKYLEEIRRIQPFGPYYFYGFSYGGMLAYEIASRLTHAGEEIGFFGLLDPPPLIDKSLLKVRVQHKMGEMKESGSHVWYAVRELPKILARRLRDVWKDGQLAYYRIAARHSRMIRTASAIGLLGLVTVFSTGFRMQIDDWRPLSEPILLRENQQLEAEFTPGVSGLHEIELVVDRTVAESELETTVFAYQAPSELDLEWGLWLGEQVIAQGTARNYQYLDLKPVRSLGAVAYTLFQIPVARNSSHLQSFGLLGNFTWGRGLGGANLDAGQTYTLRADVGRGFPELDETDPHINVRLNRRSFIQRRSEVVLQGFLGLVLIGLSMFVAGVAWVRKRQTVPPDLITYRNLKHDLRLSKRYKYLPYAGDVSLFLPERHRDVVDNTVNSWRSVIKGQLSVDVIHGARQHLELIDSEHGADVARRFARQLRIARGKRQSAGSEATVAAP